MILPFDRKSGGIASPLRSLGADRRLCAVFAEFTPISVKS
jgi:hypothetical protein